MLMGAMGLQGRSSTRETEMSMCTLWEDLFCFHWNLESFCQKNDKATNPDRCQLVSVF